MYRHDYVICKAQHKCIPVIKVLKRLIKKKRENQIMPLTITVKQNKNKIEN